MYNRTTGRVPRVLKYSTVMRLLGRLQSNNVADGVEHPLYEGYQIAFVIQIFLLIGGSNASLNVVRQLCSTT